MYTYIYIYIHTSLYAHTHTYIYICICIYIFVAGKENQEKRGTALLPPPPCLKNTIYVCVQPSNIYMTCE